MTYLQQYVTKDASRWNLPFCCEQISSVRLLEGFIHMCSTVSNSSPGIKCILLASTVGAAELKFGGLLHSTGETTAMVPVIWFIPVTALFFPLCTFQLTCRSAEHLQSGCRGLNCHHLPVLQGWVYRVGHGSSPTMWASPEVLSHPAMPKLSVHFRDPHSPLLSSDPQEMLGASLLFYRWDHKNFSAHTILTPNSCLTQVRSRGIMRARSQSNGRRILPLSSLPASILAF